MFRSTISWTLAALVAVASPHGAQAQTALVGILEGKATLVRQTTRFDVVEGASLKNEDILETAPASFVQVELSDGHRIGLGASTRVMLAPGPLRRGAAVPRLYLLQGWAKFTPAPEPRPAGAVDLTPSFEASAGSGTVIFSTDPKGFAAFVETGTLKLAARAAGNRPAAAPLSLAAGDFLVGRVGEKAVVSARPTPDFLDQMPRPFRDPLPARADRFKGRQVTLKSLGEVGYEDIAPWLGAEPGLRVPLLPRWRPRLNDKAFRDAVIAHMTAHPEWHPVVFPEKLAEKSAAKRKDSKESKEKDHAADRERPPAAPPASPAPPPPD